jgi:hypothetical protein
MSERNQQGNAGGVQGLSNTQGNRPGIWLDADKNANISHAAAKPGDGGVVQVTGSSGQIEANQKLPSKRRKAVSPAKNMEKIVLGPDADYRTVIMVRSVEALNEIKSMAESARRSVGQRTRKSKIK